MHTGENNVLQRTSDGHAVSSPSSNSSPLETLDRAARLMSAEFATQPSVTVIIPTYNRAKVVGVAIESALNQTLCPLEIIVVDDGSTDDTAAVLAAYGERIRYLRQVNQGASAARNMAIATARGKYIAFLDSDDEWLPTKLEKQVAMLEANPDLDLVACHATNDSRTYPEYDEPDAHFIKFIRNPFTPNVTRYMVRRECFEQHGVFDTSLNGPEDWEMWLRLLKNGCRFGYVPEPLIIYNYSPDSISRNIPAMRAGEAVILARYVDTLPNWWIRWRLRSQFTARSDMHLSLCHRSRGELWTSVGYMLRSLLLSPTHPNFITRLLALAVNLKLIVQRACRIRSRG